MRITIIALGSRGDVQPFVSLGKALQDDGHQVRIATFVAFSPMIAEAGLGLHPIRGDAQALVMAAGRGTLEGRLNPITTMQALRRSYVALADTIAQDLSAPSLRDTQLILNQLPGNLYGYDLAECLGVPLAIVAVIPLARTRFMPMMAFPAAFAWLPGYNSLSHRLAEQMVWALFRSAVNRWRKTELNLPALPIWGPFDDWRWKRIPVINGFSEHVVPRPPDWGEHIRTTGWWLSTEPKWQPPDDLQHFIEAGSPPVFIGFGSMPIADPAKVTTTVVDAIGLSGQRAILHAGWGRLGGQLPPEIFPLDYAPYRWLFPRMGAIVHHGGSGTTGCAFHSGVPSLIVPFGFDQFYWGSRAAEMGVGPKPMPYRELTANRLATRIQTAVHTAEMRRRAADLGQKIRAEDGIQRAVRLVEKLAA